jgi:hypothetical protein
VESHPASVARRRTGRGAVSPVRWRPPSRIINQGPWRVSTKNGLDSRQADEILGLRGVKSCRAYIITCRARQRVRTWLKLECALLIVFRELYGRVPECNSHGKGMKRKDEFEYFSYARVRRVIEELG